jgi:hypothetical protein
VLLYSVGKDNKDNDGHRNNPPGYAEGEDMTFRLWDASLRGLPAPNTPPPDVEVNE